VLYDMIGIVLVNAAVAVLHLFLIRRNLLDRNDRWRGFGLYLVVAPIGLLAWLERDATLAVLIPFTLTGAVLLLRRRDERSGFIF
jgi:hypothetical protein